MNDLKVIRQSTTAEREMVFEFETSGIEFLIKNLSDADIFVACKQGVEKRIESLFLRICVRL